MYFAAQKNTFVDNFDDMRSDFLVYAQCASLLAPTVEHSLAADERN